MKLGTHQMSMDKTMQFCWCQHGFSEHVWRRMLVSALTLPMMNRHYQNAC